MVLESTAIRAAEALWDSARGVVSLGGNALEDCDRLYDGT